MLSASYFNSFISCLSKKELKGKMYLHFLVFLTALFFSGVLTREAVLSLEAVAICVIIYDIVDLISEYFCKRKA